VLSSGSDPVASFNTFCAKMNMEARNEKISLGSGQDKKATALIE
jgi:hypothetical protein